MTHTAPTRRRSNPWEGTPFTPGVSSHLPWNPTDKGVLFEDKGVLFEDKGALLEDKTILFEDKGALLADKTILFEDKGALLADKTSLLEDKGALLAAGRALFADKISPRTTATEREQGAACPPLGTPQAAAKIRRPPQPIRKVLSSLRKLIKLPC